MSIIVRTGPELVGHDLAIGVAFEVVVLATLSATVGVGIAGWISGFAFALGVSGLLAIGLRRRGQRSLGPADQVTLARAMLVGAVTALVAESFVRPAPAAVLVVLSVTALVLDGVDGRVARHTGTSSPLGARFDMEVDAFLILVLSVYVAAHLGGWVLLIGLMRYAFVAASWRWPWLRAPLPSRLSGKTVAAAQGIVLVAAASNLLPVTVDVVLVALALTALGWSFGRDVRWLFRRVQGTVSQPAPGRLA